MEQQKKTFAVKLKGLAPWISEIQYEKEERDLTLYFSLKRDAEINIIVEDGGAGHKLFSPATPPLGALSQKLISSVEYKPNSDLYIASLCRQDFQACGATSLALKDAVEELKQCGGENSSLLVLLETGKGTQGLLWSKRPEVREKVKMLEQGTEKGNWVLFAPKGPLPSLREAFKARL
ncbi:MAG: hypothetical protein A3D64_02365 [Candidatus Wildermuthbacteria bacterium RIFCSPHIGHO2_02_FULL_49_9]|uniref:Uncharacterized protein n=2 Tax=Candidatus Wildermuthiibacteriota TaxID=1817923 RepID=A0A1G2QXC5_9BACT|nr:MAG: hypothetical protein A2672_01945 [Candidatus Wildermuthbacteria bacterium RIFCSPHIGHO2_01_FULL_49_22b]OHA70418.1 MAG: hypothetical protein A3D64_02365 [Candidatus Wildermuthbacteria bacterium RIFCSPHIGHO2_02_FULL_49_9]